MATQNKFAVISTAQALEDLDDHQYFAIALDDGKIANNGHEACGIILNKAKTNEHVDYGVIGEFKFRAGGAASIGNKLRVTTSGYFVTAASGYYTAGRAKAAVTSGSIGTGFFNFSAPMYQNVDSL